MSFTNDYESKKCDEVLEKIEQETELSKSLQKELAVCKNNLRVCEILQSPEFAATKLFQVRVKVFRTFAELLSVLPEKLTHAERSSRLLQDPPMPSNIFLIEVLVSTAFHNKLVASEWLVNFAIQAAGARKTGKSVVVQRNQPVDAITAVLAYPRRRQNDEEVRVSLTQPTTGRSVELATLVTDISFKFASPRWGALGAGVEEQIAKINRPEAASSYRLCAPPSGEWFIAALVRNAFASLDPAQIVCNEGNRVAEIEINDQRVRLQLDGGGGGGCLRMLAPREELCQLKRYFTTAAGCLPLNDASGSRKWLKRDFHHIQSVNVLKEARARLTQALAYNRVDIHDLLNVYDVYQRFIDACPL